jgi:hypothetical protein
VWAIGSVGAALHWNGSSWSPSATGSVEHLIGLWGSGSGNVWAVGAAGVILRHP